MKKIFLIGILFIVVGAGFVACMASVDSETGVLTQDEVIKQLNGAKASGQFGSR